MFQNLSLKYIRNLPRPNPAIGTLTFLTILSSVGAWVYCWDSSESLHRQTSEEEHKEMKKWSSSLQDPSHENFNPFRWKNTPNEFGYKK